MKLPRCKYKMDLGCSYCHYDGNNKYVCTYFNHINNEQKCIKDVSLWEVQQ